MINDINVPLIDDFHTHLRQGNMMETVVPLIRNGGTRLALVMVSFTVVINKI